MEFKNKKILLMGLGILGRGVGDAEYLLDKGAKLTITDLKSESELQESVERLKKHKNAKNIKWRLGEHRIEDFLSADLIVKGAGVSMDSPFVKEAIASGKKVTMSTALFEKLARQIGVRTIGVTGTKGKSTTTFMIYESLKKSSLSSGIEIFLGGNAYFDSTLALLDKVKEGDIAVLELDSWQLQGYGYEKISPNIAVFTNFFEDHMNYYNSLDDYYKDKANIYLYQNLKEGDILFVGKNVPKEFLEKFPPPTGYIEASYLPETLKLKVEGEHNRANASLAREVLVQIGLSENEADILLSVFRGVPGRLFYKGTLEHEGKKVHLYDDNNSTTPSSTLESLKTLEGKYKEITLILGGNSKNLKTDELANYLNTRKDIQVFLTPGSGSDILAEKINAKPLPSTKQALEKALESTKDGQVILFSPAFSSFAEFKNEYERQEFVNSFFEKFLTKKN